MLAPAFRSIHAESACPSAPTSQYEHTYATHIGQFNIEIRSDSKRQELVAQKSVEMDMQSVVMPDPQDKKEEVSPRKQLNHPMSPQRCFVGTEAERHGLSGEPQVVYGMVGDEQHLALESQVSTHFSEDPYAIHSPVQRMPTNNSLSPANHTGRSSPLSCC